VSCNNKERPRNGAKERVPAVSIAEDARERVALLCKERGVSEQALLAGSRTHKCSAIRKQLAREFVEKSGMSYAGAARLLGISASAVNQILMRESKKL
jgi:hypothetical protein